MSLPDDDEKTSLLKDDQRYYSISDGDTEEEKDGGHSAKIEVTPSLIRCSCPYVLEPAILVYAIVGSMIGELGQQYTYKKVAEDLGPAYANLTTNNHAHITGCNTSAQNSTDYKMREYVQKEVARFQLYSTLASFLPMIVSFMFWGAYSDSVGRKILMILPPIGTILEAVMYILTMKLHLSQYVMFLCPMMESAIGAQDILTMGAVAYVADTATDNKAFRVALIDLTLMVGYGIGEFSVGYLIKATGFFWSFVMVICGKFLMLLYVLLFIPQTRPVSDKTERGICKYLTGTARAYTKGGQNGRRWKLFLLLFVYLVPRLCYDTKISTLFQLNAPLCWSSVWMGIYKGMSTFIHGFGIFFGAKVLIQFLPILWVTAVGLLSGFLAFTYIAFVQNTLMMFFVPVIGVFYYLPLPMLRTIMSDIVESTEQGAMLAGLALSSSLSRSIADMLMNPLYQATVDRWTGVAFLADAAAYLLGLLALLLYIVLIRRQKNASTILSSTSSSKFD